MATTAGVSSVVIMGAAVVLATVTGSTLSFTTSCHGHDWCTVLGATVVLGMSV